MGMKTTFHIRRRLPRKGGNQWYKTHVDNRVVSTYCGVEPTEYDGAWNKKAEAWTHPWKGEMLPCKDCKATRG